MSDSESRRVIAFTGIPGVGIQQAALSVASAMGFEVPVISIDQYAWDAFCDEARARPALLEETELRDEEVAGGSKPNWWEFLTLPISQIRRYWLAGATRALEEVKASSADLVFITLHAHYQSDAYRWTLSPVDPKTLQEFGIRTFICLIDDVYDVHARRPEDIQAERRTSLTITGKQDNFRLASTLVRLTVDKLDDLIRLETTGIILNR